MNIFAKHNQFTWERSLQITWNKWVAYLTSEANVCKTWYIMMMIVDLKSLIFSLSSDSWMSWW